MVTVDALRGPARAWRLPAWLTSPLFRTAFGAWLGTRLALIAATYLTAVFFHAGNGTQLGRVLETAWMQWDGDWYYLISRYGYFGRQAANFFPLYPALIAFISHAVGDGNGLGGYLRSRLDPVPVYDPVRVTIALAISNLAALAGFLGVTLLAYHEYRSLAVARRAVLLVAAYPLAFFLAAPFAESLFFAAAAFALYLARRGSWWPAAAAAFLAGLDRPIAIVLVPPLVYEYARQQGWLSREVWTRLREQGRRLLQLGLGWVGVAVAMPLGTAVYMLYLWRWFSNPLLFSTTQNTLWGHHFTPLWTTVRDQLRIIVSRFPHKEEYKAMSFVDFGSVALVAGIAVLGWRRQPLMFTLYLLGLVLVASADPRFDIPNPLVGDSRYMISAVPAYLAGAAWLESRPRLATALVMVGFALQGALLMGYLFGIYRVRIF